MVRGEWQVQMGASLGVGKDHDSFKLDLGLLCTVHWWLLPKD